MVARYDSIFLYEYDYLQKDSLIHVNLAAKFDNAFKYIEAIEPDSSWQEVLQFTLLEFLNLVKTDTLLSSGELYNLANTCPDKYGDPVYHARSLIRQDSIKIHYEDENLCSYLNPRTIADITTHAGTLFPNPASTEIQVVSASEIKALHIFAISGREIHLNSHISDKIAIVDVSSLPPGLYHLRSYSEDGKLEFYRFIIAGR